VTARSIATAIDDVRARAHRVPTARPAAACGCALAV